MRVGGDDTGGSGESDAEAALIEPGDGYPAFGEARPEEVRVVGSASEGDDDVGGSDPDGGAGHDGEYD